VTLKVKDPLRPTKEFSVYMRQLGGIDALLLQSAPGIREATFKFMCSDKHPATPRTMEDIDRLLSSSNIKIMRELASHRNDPEAKGDVNHSLKIETNLDNPNLDDKFISDARDVHEEPTSKLQIKMINERFEQANKIKRRVETSDDDSDILKPLDESKTTMKVAEVEKG
jgi:hypothetical protein